MADREYDHNNILRLTSEADKKVSLQLGVYNGYASITIRDDKDTIVRFSLPRSFLVFLKEELHKVLAGTPSFRKSAAFNKWDNEAKKVTQLGNIYVGRDDKAIIYLGIQAPGRTAIKFVLKTPFSFDSGEPLTDVQKSELTARTLIEQLTVDIPTAMIITSFKREGFPQKGGGVTKRSDTELDLAIF